ncbi:MAG: alpha,alpha-trehalose-phosphate synthase (UDP-forming) [Alphaproteobacteria bacterium]|nr:MAG: alpha,alpha-trehalose-phosphate synthase (UDP-forming) [Alphaproteobacteria bacterium]
MTRLVIVSNRVAPIKRSKAGNEGGLAVAVAAAIQGRGGLWFGWSGKVYEHEPGPVDIFEIGNLTYATVDLSHRDYDEYYNGYANRTLWPLFHYRLDLSEFDRRYRTGYERVNAMLAGKLIPLLRPGDLIWVHDYHLIPMASHLRRMGCRQRIGFFLHIPWPNLEILLALPNHRDLVRALCEYDLVGFQTERDLRAFHEYIEFEAGGTIDDGGVVRAYGRHVRTDTFPIGIDAEAFAQYAQKAESSPQTQRLCDSVGGRRLLIGVDRLDYSKGLVARMEAIDHLLSTYPDLRGRIVMLQIAPPSRADVPEYMMLRHEVESVVGRVNGTYAEFDWAPIRYLNKGFRRQTLAGFYRSSRVGVVTPLRDGMNLVAKEYVAAQREADPGVLVLSRFAGAACELDGAVIVNPYDIEGVAEGLRKALTMSLEERRERWSSMVDRVRQYDVIAWQQSFLDRLSAAPSAPAA